MGCRRDFKLDAGAGFAIQNSSGATTRLRVDEATGNISRNGALFVHTTGSTTNTFVGVQAGGPATIGSLNSAFGYRALPSNTTGAGNSAFGYGALRDTTTGIRNSAFGTYALWRNTANDGSAFGTAALSQNTSGPFTVPTPGPSKAIQVAPGTSGVTRARWTLTLAS
ncbi:MAG TPA: hypothetical protein VMS55_08495 [Myxococcota bacterium]|nr:hypothetical protein [Myxococcota bacterium]